ncbi:MAG: tripartite-type tricarboxylate transporter receptor subunit TctC [Alphaproteobacteria bacterium]|jgi:tripartite-type tricarboxylate transporter receptor subunit TctC
MKLTLKRTIPLALVAAGLVASPAIAASVADHYKKKTITILIGYGPGGTYDKYAMTMSRHYGNHIPGKPNVIVQHMPGAGGSKAMNYAYNVMQTQGYNMVMPLDNIVINQLLRPERMRYESEKFTWLGSSNQTNNVLVVRSDTGVTDLKSWGKKSLIGSTSGKSSNGYIIPRIVMATLGLKGKIVTGYKGSSKSIFAIEQGESQMAAFNWLAWASKVPHWFTGAKPYAKAIVQIGQIADPDIPGVPRLGDIVEPKFKKAVAFLASSGPLGRGLAFPPKVPNRLVAPMRAAYDAMNADKVYGASLKKRKLRLMATDGATLQKIVNQAVKETTPAVIKQVRELIFGGNS